MKYIIDIRDSYPQVFSTFGKISSDGVVFKFLYFLNKVVFSKAHHIISATSGIDKLVLENSKMKKQLWFLMVLKLPQEK